MSFEKYINTVSGNFKRAVKVEWLNADESIKYEFTNSLYDINVDLSVNYQNGSRRTCTLTLNNDKNKFPIDFNSIWLGQKFKLWMGVFLDDNTPYYFPQGVFYVSNPEEVYQPSTKTIKINGVDKWAYLDGTLNGKLSATYQTNIGADLYDATKSLLRLPTVPLTSIMSSEELVREYFEVETYRFSYKTSSSVPTYGSYALNTDDEAKISFTAKKDMTISFDYSAKMGGGSATKGKNEVTLTIERKNTNTSILVEDKAFISGEPRSFINSIFKGDKITIFCKVTTKNTIYSFNVFNLSVGSSLDVLDVVQPFISPVFKTKTYTKPDGTEEKDLWKCPYTVKIERGKTYADILLEYATILCAHIYYDVHGRLTIEPMIDTADDITDINKEILWHYTVDEKTFLGLTQTYSFDKIYNDIIVLGNIVNGYQFKARVQNRNPMSDTCVQKIGIKTKEPFEDNQYYSNEQCLELAKYYAKVDTILQKSGDINSTSLYHLDVNKLVTVSTTNNNMSKEPYLITGLSLNSSGAMSISVVSVNVLKNFSVVEEVEAVE